MTLIIFYFYFEGEYILTLFLHLLRLEICEQEIIGAGILL